MPQLGFLQNAVGGISGPFEVVFSARGVKTLALRMERHCANALHIARWLEASWTWARSTTRDRRAIRSTTWQTGRCTASAEWSRYPRGTWPKARHFLERCRLFALAESLGGVESLIEHPGLMTHASIPAEVRAKHGIDDGLVRLSVGIEEGGGI